MKIPQRGEIWIVALDPTKGSEIKKTRPCLVISRNEHNQKANTITIIPCSSGPVKYRAWEVELDKNSGLEDVSHLLIPQIRIAAKERLKRKIGYIPFSKWAEIEEKLMFYLGFDKFLTSSISIDPSGIFSGTSGIGPSIYIQ